MLYCSCLDRFSGPSKKPREAASATSGIDQLRPSHLLSWPEQSPRTWRRWLFYAPAANSCPLEFCCQT
jgi:hypothetical protein